MRRYVCQCVTVIRDQGAGGATEAEFEEMRVDTMNKLTEVGLNRYCRQTVGNCDLLGV